MKWGRLLFAMVCGMACISFLIDGQTSLALFFGVVCSITVWSMSWGGKGGRKD